MKRYFSSIKQYSWILVACTVIAAAGGLVLSRAQPVTYQVSAIMYVDVGAPGTTFSSTGASSATAADSLTAAANYAAEILTRAVMRYVYQQYPQIGRRGYTADDLLVDILPVASTTSPIITITATAPTPGDGVLLANAVANGFESYVQKQLQDHLNMLRQNIQNQLAVYQKENTDLENKIQQLNNPQDPRSQLWTTDRSDVIHNIDLLESQLQQLPTTIRSDVYVVQEAKNSDAQPTAKASIIVAATAFVGLLLGAAIMLLMIFLDNRLRSEEEVKQKLGLAYLGSLTSERELEINPTQLSGPAAQQVADICANLRLADVLAGKWQAPHGAVLLITSPQSAEGKTTLAAALATTFVRSGGTAVVVDGNLHQPSTHLVFGISPAGIGLSGLLRSKGQPVDDAVIRSNIPGLWLLPAGKPLDESSFLLGQQMPAILAQLRQKTDLVIIDGPALLAGADASQLASMADGVALVIDTRHEKLPQLLRTKELLKSLAHTPAGVVMNRFVRRGRKGNRYYASAFPIEERDEDWVSVKSHDGNGHSKDAAKGQRVEQVADPLVGMPPPPAPQTTKTSTLPSAPMAGRPMMPGDPTIYQQIPGSPGPSPWRADMMPPPALRPGRDE